MQVPKVVPWSSEAELQLIKEEFYNGDKLQALSKVKVLESRGVLPPSIEATSLLMSAIITDNGSGDSYTARCAYSMALVRFVNGQLDHYQRGQTAIPLSKLAQLGGLPAFFVELRHTATHESLPSLEFLRDSCARALDWLWERYWSVNDYVETEQAQDEERKKQIKESFREWRRMRKGDLVKRFKPGDTSEDGRAFWQLVRTFETFQAEHEELLMDVMWNENVMIPKNPKEEVPKYIRLLSPLIELLNKEGFVQRLAAYGVDILNQQASGTPRDPPTELPVDRIMAWLKFLSSGPKPWLNTHEFAKHCLVKPRLWNLQLLNHLGISEFEKLAKDMEAVINSPAANKRRLEDIEDQPVKRQASARNETGSGGDTPWAVVPNWSPRALGVL